LNIIKKGNKSSSRKRRRVGRMKVIKAEFNGGSLFGRENCFTTRSKKEKIKTHTKYK
jgi:hypothetical protein